MPYKKSQGLNEESLENGNVTQSNRGKAREEFIIKTYKFWYIEKGASGIPYR